MANPFAADLVRLDGDRWHIHLHVVG